MSTDVDVENLLRKELINWVIISLMEGTSVLCQRYSFLLVHCCGKRVIEDLTQTASWSLIPAIELQQWISDGLLVINMSKVLLALVGKFTTWVKPCSRKNSIIYIVSHRARGYAEPM